MNYEGGWGFVVIYWLNTFFFAEKYVAKVKLTQNLNNSALFTIPISFLDAKDVFALLKGKGKLAPGEEPTFTWFKGGQEFDPDDRFKVKLFYKM